MMTVQELIDRLSQYPSDTVCVNGEYDIEIKIDHVFGEVQITGISN